MPIDPKTIKWDEPATIDKSKVTWDEPGVATSVAAGLGSGVGRAVLGVQRLLGQGIEKVGNLGSSPSITDLIVKPKGNIVQRAGQWLIEDADTGRMKLADEVAPYKTANPMSAGAGELTGEVLATLPVGGVLAKGAQALGAAPTVVRALQTTGMTTGAKVAPGVLPALGNLATRSGAAAATGGVSGLIIDPDSAGTSAVVSGLFPVAGKVLGAGANAALGTVKPFFNAGQDDIARRALREFAEDPKKVAAALKASRELIPGSAPTTVTAAGDIGLASLNRTLQNVDSAYAAEATRRSATQNAARTAAIEDIAGNTGKLEIAKAARDAATDHLRESALNAAGGIDASRVLGSLDSMLKYPSNAGRLSQQALNTVRNQIAGATENGVIDARALYAIRKDINDILGGKLQGEAGNLKYASSQLIQVRDMFDNAIDQATRKVQAGNGTSVALNAGPLAGPNAAGMAPRTTWKQYLEEYKRQSVPINQMEMLEGIYKAIKMDKVDAGGNFALSAAKLNNILKTQGPELRKTLSPEQLQLVRNLAADLNAQQTADLAGRAVGSNTVQNLASANMLQGVLGKRIGGSTPIENSLGRATDWAYKRANAKVQQKLNAAMLDPQEAVRLLEPAKRGSFATALQKMGNAGVNQLPYRVAPLTPGRSTEE
ncbi:hypothetical protein [Rhodoferax mekongensis]|uniref:hypothetical protein n=1 Tax=Rhodoferax mekongensis TaxID=3068341 RepID=UPI0028BE209E|nr:hypothetical protein [Rhodoferax sp. TBRC 17199]MDT7514687.1 hypothetical protein [Rhodoferax sp. TBRC 17199]